MNTEECPKAPVEDIVYLKRLGGCGAQMKGLLQGAEITRFPCVGMVDPPRGGGSMEMRQPLAEGLGLWVPHACCRPLLWEVPNLRSPDPAVPFWGTTTHGERMLEDFVFTTLRVSQNK